MAGDDNARLVSRPRAVGDTPSVFVVCCRRFSVRPVAGSPAGPEPAELRQERITALVEGNGVDAAGVAEPAR
jgi:hypothetical protein